MLNITSAILTFIDISYGSMHTVTSGMSLTHAFLYPSITLKFSHKLICRHQDRVLK